MRKRFCVFGGPRLRKWDVCAAPSLYGPLRSYVTAVEQGLTGCPWDSGLLVVVAETRTVSKGTGFLAAGSLAIRLSVIRETKLFDQHRRNAVRDARIGA